MNYGTEDSNGAEGFAGRTENDALIEGIRGATPAQNLDPYDPEIVILTDSDGRKRVVDTFETLRSWEKKRAKSGQFTVHSPESFIAYVSRHQTDGTEVWFDSERSLIAAHIDGDKASPAEAGGLHQHDVVLKLVDTPDWAAWKSLDRKYISQTRLAEFIIDHYATFTKPSMLEMLELAETFNVTQKVEFTSNQRIKDGSRSFAWVETIGESKKQGQTVLPEKIELTIQMFEHTEFLPMSARWHYRINQDKQLEMKLLLEDVVAMEYSAFTSLCEQITGGLHDAGVEAPVFYGKY